MKFSFRWKVIAAFLAIVFVSMIALTVLSSVLLKPIFVTNSKKTMLDYTQKISAALTEAPDGVDAVLEELNLSYGITTHIVDEKGVIRYSYQKNQTNIQKPRYKRHIALYDKKRKEDNYYFKELIDETDNVKKIIYVSKDNDYYIVMNKAVKGIEQDIRIVSLFIMIMGCSIAIVGTVVWSVFSKSFTDAMKKMSRITKEMSELNFEKKINHKSNDEIGILADSIDALSDELKNSIEELKKDIEHRKRLVRDISHELKTPITTVKGYLESIQVITEDNERLQRYCRIANEECDEINSLVEEMLDMSRMESEEYICDKETVSTKDIEQILKNKIEAEYSSQKISMSFEKGKLMCNSVLLSRAVMNYVKNAVKYGKKDKAIVVSGAICDDRYVFSVMNEGAAISEDEKAMLWDLFYKNDKSRRRDSSHGIGLAMVKRIAEIHDGDVGVESKDGKNRFYLSVPMTK